MNIGGHLVAETLVRTLVIVMLEVDMQAGSKLRYRGVLLYVDVLVLDCAPEPLNEDVIENPTAAVHTNANFRRFQLAVEIVRSELSTPSAALRAGFGRC